MAGKRQKQTLAAIIDRLVIRQVEGNACRPVQGLKHASRLICVPVDAEDRRREKLPLGS